MAKWQPGQCGNPGGRPKKTKETYDLEEACRLVAPDLLPIAIAIANDPDAKHSDRMMAINSIWNRGLGAPRQKAEVDQTVRTAAVAVTPADISIDDIPAFVAQALGEVDNDKTTAH